ncbi:hypothetical protein P152DRAFT_14864 [Eremomyces bilateralis CBS 781.70]|uniref:Transposase IS30-like HTH domain-containing protein n=1 Tax=Eremomyces bilateralis CBS 781.70 TaxID=1392243 RepID=A0A6G1GH35_9PEZI|nr:uncharacterized protein P152DRAFT_14864 [Eremomyces bilateralis CBS 781.70]KAF1817302.1 hypothetical protein P152DRAFT_14864 [Eremomyces bilateralis CBS 781.70]
MMERSILGEISGNRRKHADLTPEQRSAIIAMVDAGLMSKRAIAREVGCSPSTVDYTIDQGTPSKSTVKPALRGSK